MIGLEIEPSARASKKFGMCWGTYIEEGLRIPFRELTRSASREAVTLKPLPGAISGPEPEV